MVKADFFASQHMLGRASVGRVVRKFPLMVFFKSKIPKSFISMGTCDVASQKPFLVPPGSEASKT